MSLLGWVVGAAILDEWGRREEQERELGGARPADSRAGRADQPVGGDAGTRRPRPVGIG